MKVIIDTNVLISAALRDRDPETVILFVVDHPGVLWIASPAIIDEYRRVLVRPGLALSSAVRERWSSMIDAATTLVEVPDSIHFPRDPKDAPFVACAIASGADYLITGDADLRDAQIGRTTILTVSRFKHLMTTKPSSIATNGPAKPPPRSTP